MQQINFETAINASVQKVWNTMWFHQSYKLWTNVFCEGSYFKGEFKEGEKVHFLTPKGEGMHSLVEEWKPNEKVVFKHLGEIKNFIEQPFDNDSWTGLKETYSYKEENGVTTVFAIQDAAPEFVDWFNNIFPKAMQMIKEICEKPTNITVETIVNSSIDKVWNYFTTASHIEKWYAANNDWHTPTAANNLEVDGNFDYRMEAKDGSFGFNFKGTFNKVEEHKHIAFAMEDGRKCAIDFLEENGSIKVIECFEAEEQNSYELQEMGWKAILNNFKNYTENN